MSTDPEWLAEISADMGQTMALHPDLTPADLGARLARTWAMSWSPTRSASRPRPPPVSLRSGEGPSSVSTADRLSRNDAREQDGQR